MTALLWILAGLLALAVLSPLAVLVCFLLSLAMQKAVDDHNREWGPASPREVARKHE